MSVLLSLEQQYILVAATYLYAVQPESTLPTTAVQVLTTEVVDDTNRSTLPCAAFPRMGMVRYGTS